MSAYKDTGRELRQRRFLKRIAKLIPEMVRHVERYRPPVDRMLGRTRRPDGTTVELVLRAQVAKSRAWGGPDDVA